MRVLAIDYGTKRIGLAISDPLGVLATGLDTLRRKNIRADIAHIAELVRTREVGRIVVGNPLLLDGRPSEISMEAEAFARRLSESTGVGYEMWDERLTSREAATKLRETGRQPRRDGGVDKLAATIILDSYLMSRI
jgi:putative holliday junction resolvase